MQLPSAATYEGQRNKAREEGCVPLKKKVTIEGHVDIMLHHISGIQRPYTVQYYMAPASAFIRQKQNQVLSLLYILSVHFNSSEHHYTALLVFLYTGKIIVILWV